MNEQIFDRNKVRIHRDKIAQSFEYHDFLFNYCAEDIIERVLNLPISDFKNILEIGTRNGYLTKLLQREFKDSTYIVTDISYNMLKQINEPSNILIVQNDEENLCFQENSFDLIVSNLNMQWINNVPNFLYQIKNILNPGGYFIGSFFGGGTLSVLKKKILKLEIDNLGFSMPHFMPIFDIELLVQVLNKIKFSDIIVDNEIIEVKYPSLYNLINDLKLMGESSKLIRGSPVFSKKILNLTKNKDGITENFEIFNFVVKK